MHSSSGTFTVSRPQMEEQLRQGSTWIKNHRVWTDPAVQVITEEGARSPQQVVFYLATGRWHDEFFNNCGVENCITGLHNSETKAHADEVKDAEDLILIQTHHAQATTQATTLADLYRKGKARGLLKPATSYGG